MVLRLRVTSSPFKPSPLVEPFTNNPFSYISSTPSPSSFGSAIYSGLLSFSLFLIRSLNRVSSSLFMAFAKESIGSLCCTTSNLELGFEPTL